MREAADRGVSKQAWCGRVFTMSTEKNMMHERQPAAHNRVARTFCEVNVTACLTHVRILESRDPRSCHLGSSCARMTAVAAKPTAMPKRRNDQGADETDLRTCPICLQAITRRATVYQSRCQPAPHDMHMRCWKRQTKSQRAQCCVCRQNTVDDLTFIAVAELCGVGRNPMRARHA